MAAHLSFASWILHEVIVPRASYEYKLKSALWLCPEPHGPTRLTFQEPYGPIRATFQEPYGHSNPTWIPATMAPAVWLMRFIDDAPAVLAVWIFFDGLSGPGATHRN